MELQAYRTGTYTILAEALKQPDADFVGELPEMVKFLHQAFTTLAYPIPLFDYQDWPALGEDLDKLTADYTLSFVYPPDSRVVPVESVYRQWTMDASAKVPFAKEKGYLMGDAALHMQALYAGYGLVIPPEFAATPDHLCLELEFASFLLENASAERQAIFWREHLDWVDDLCQDAETTGIPLFYRQVLKVTAGFLRAEREKL